MSYRMDEGHGRCMYRLGVEDDGCHSLLSYEQVAESARVVEWLARSLNAIVVERKMIQNEVYFDEFAGEPVRYDNTKGGPMCVEEAPILGDSFGSKVVEKKEDGQLLHKEDGIYTRAELTIQRIETHLLDPSPDVTQSNDLSNEVLNATKDKEKPFSVAETLSARNLRIAVVGNVDAGTFKIPSPFDVFVVIALTLWLSTTHFRQVITYWHIDNLPSG